MLENPRTYADGIREHLRSALANSTQQYLKLGLLEFHQKRRKSYANIQAAAGNLTVAIELMLKAFLVNKNPLLVLRGLPLDLQVLFACSESVPEAFDWRRYDIDLRSFHFKTAELDECVSAFYVFFPGEKQKLSSHLRFLSRIRNASVHAALPSFQTYDFERVAYLSLRVLEVLRDTGALQPFPYSPTQSDSEFISAFQEERVDRVRGKIEEAKKRSKKLQAGRVILSAEGWELYTQECPICGSEALLTGYTDSSGEEYEEGVYSPCLDFFADSFECTECGLLLEDAEEMLLAGMEIVHDRSDDLDRWVAEEQPY